MVKRKSKLKILTILLFSMVFLSQITPININYYSDNDISQKTQIDPKIEKIKANAVITEEIRINASDPARNWLWAVSQPWCSGSGFKSDPYVIENLVIDCQNSHSGIVIEESQNSMFNEYFRIQNNIIYNVGDTDSNSAGIKIYKTRDGEIINNNISSSRDGNYGIHLVGDPFMMMQPTIDINITDNYITNTERGIYLEERCSDIIIRYNTAKENSLSGIYLAKGNKRINVTNNILDENDVFGIADTGSGMIGMSTDANNIVNNSICNNAYGFYLAQTFYSNIALNNISFNDINGIYISGSQDSTIRDNVISDNTEKGILMVMGPMGSLRNKIYRNSFLRNGEHAVELTNIPWSWDQNNWTWWQGLPGTSPKIGNYWDNYTGADNDDDGFGDSPYNFTGNKDERPIWNDGIYDHVISINGTWNAPNNWDWAKDRFWCTGSGMMGDPYVIGPNDLWDGKIDAWGKQAGITIIESDQNFRIEGVTITNSSFAGIKTNNVKWFDAAIIESNISFNNGHGIYLEMTNKLNITNCDINNNTGNGIYLFNDTGGLGPLDNVNIINNLISGNGDDGIHINLACDNNNITGNDIILNGGYGINVNETTIYGCNDTQINENYISGNKIANARDTAKDTRWYLGERGNEWGDYKSLGGIDFDDNGIGDIPYNISQTPLIQDFFPIFEDGYEETALFINDTWNAPNNWAWASKKLFVSGSGMSWDPYVIENVRFNGSDSVSPIRIINSNAKYFRIENCTLYNIGGPYSGSAGVSLSNVDHGEIINNTYSTNNDGNYGIYLGNGCSSINITNNLVENENYLSNKFKYGIYLDTSGAAIPNQNVIDRNIIRNNHIGIYLSDGSPSNNVTNNEITDNTEIGIFIDTSNMNNIYYNEILNNGNGTIIENNAITNNIVGNNIEDNVDFGLYLNSSGNFIYYNNFIDNRINAQDDTTMGMNTWYKVLVPLGRGNFWSNYTEMGADAKDADDDGIGDIAYDLIGAANAQDLYPIYTDGYNGSRLIIDGNLAMGHKSWNWAASRTWCTGSGTEWDPYIIKNLVIDGMQNGSCIYIFDSSSVHFIIDNATLYNSSETASPEPAGGIRLVNVRNAEIINCNIFDNGGHGIVIRGIMLETRNITIHNNIINNNNRSGIYINGSMCFNIELNNNSISSNKEYGICVSELAYNIMISNNYLNDNDIAGISIIEAGWMGNDIYNNTIIYGGIGILIDGYNPVDVFYNNISNVNTDGIAIQYSAMMMMDLYGINITGNRIHDCSENGINFGGDNPIHSMDNKIIENYIYNNGEAGITLQDFDGSIIAKNTLVANGIGISLSYLNMFNEIKDNLLLNNIDEGIAIFDISCENNRIYNNNFTGNGMNGFDFGIDNSWYFMNVGNYWDDYPGTDADDDNLGDTSYDLIGGDLMNPKDLYPKWWDAPNFTILKPQQDAQLSAEENPEFVIKFDEGESYNLWYSIIGVGTSPITVKFTPPRIVGGPDFIEKIDSNLWKNTPQGQRTIRFYTNDSRGYVRYNDVLITKLNATDVGARIITPPADDDDDTTAADDDGEEEGLPWWLQAIFTGMISASAGLVIKISYSAHKRRKELYRKISDNLDRIDNIEKFLQDRLGFEDWAKLKESLEKYQKHEISSKQLVKQSKKSVGKKFMHIFMKPKHKKKKK